VKSAIAQNGGIIMDYYFSKSLNVSFDKAVDEVTEELGKEGFGILAEIDVKDTLKKKIGVDFKKYKILGACNPHFAYRALQVEDKIGLMMPFNVIVQEISEKNIEVAAVDPVASILAIANPEVQDNAKQLRIKLQTVIDNL